MKLITEINETNTKDKEKNILKSKYNVINKRKKKEKSLIEGNN